MPVIVITDYTWRQTPEEIIITMPIVGRPTKVDVFAVDNYVKASYPPFILELFLWSNILEDESQCTLGESSAVFTLKKAEIDCEWPSLVLDNLTKDKKREYRNRALERAQLAAEERTLKIKEKQQELQRLAVQKQIEKDTETLNKIQTIRDGHRKEAMAEFENWRHSGELAILNNEQAIVQENRKSYKAPLQWFGRKSLDCDSRENAETTNSRQILPYVATEQSSILIKKSNDKDNERGKQIIDRLLSGKYRLKKETKVDIDDDTNIPLPRESGKISVNFSERAFPTPARESYHLEEQEWLEKQAEARRKCGFATEDLRPEEQDPQWLKDKGDEFFKVGNYLAAVSAYTHGIKLSDKMSCLYANRSAAQYALNNYKRCAEDASMALELMVPKCEGNRESRARCHARLGAALCKLSAPQHGIPELEAALKLAPDNDTIKRDLHEARQYFQVQ